jgi:hypothetical protein
VNADSCDAEHRCGARLGRSGEACSADFRGAKLARRGLASAGPLEGKLSAQRRKARRRQRWKPERSGRACGSMRRTRARAGMAGGARGLLQAVRKYASSQILFFVSTRMLNFVQATSRVRFETRNRKSGSSDLRPGRLQAQANIIEMPHQFAVPAHGRSLNGKRNGLGRSTRPRRMDALHLRAPSRPRAPAARQRHAGSSNGCIGPGPRWQLRASQRRLHESPEQPRPSPSRGRRKKFQLETICADQARGRARSRGHGQTQARGVARRYGFDKSFSA